MGASEAQSSGPACGLPTVLPDSAVAGGGIDPCDDFALYACAELGGGPEFVGETCTGPTSSFELAAEQTTRIVRQVTEEANPRTTALGAVHDYCMRHGTAQSAADSYLWDAIVVMRSPRDIPPVLGALAAHDVWGPFEMRPALHPQNGTEVVFSWVQRGGVGPLDAPLSELEIRKLLRLPEFRAVFDADADAAVALSQMLAELRASPRARSDYAYVFVTQEADRDLVPGSEWAGRLAAALGGNWVLDGFWQGVHDEVRRAYPDGLDRWAAVDANARHGTHWVYRAPFFAALADLLEGRAPPGKHVATLPTVGAWRTYLMLVLVEARGAAMAESLQAVDATAAQFRSAAALGIREHMVGRYRSSTWRGRYALQGVEGVRTALSVDEIGDDEDDDGARCRALVWRLLRTEIEQLYSEAVFEDPKKHATIKQMSASVLEAMRDIVASSDQVASPEDMLDKLRRVRMRTGTEAVSGKPLPAPVQREIAQFCTTKSAEPTLMEVIDFVAPRIAVHSSLAALATMEVGDLPLPMPATVANAYYDPRTNNITILPGITMAPFWTPQSSLVTLHGTLGSIIGHEYMHALDEVGQYYSPDGSLAPPAWALAGSAVPRDVRECFVDSFTADTVLDVRNNGELTLNENLADHVGMRAALASLHGPEYGGSPDLRAYFIAYAQLWCMPSETQYQQRMQSIGDVHSIAAVRVRETLRHTPNFHDTFSCPTDSGMACVESEACTYFG